MRLVRWDDYPVATWRNGNGTTREVARGPASSPAGADDFDWRVSIADVTASSAFSTFPDVRRVIVQVAGGPMVLTVDGQEQLLEVFRPFSFDGGAATSCRPSAGATTDLNVMTRHGTWTARVGVHDDLRVRLDPPAEAVVVVVALSGRRTVTAGDEVARLGLWDAVLLGGGSRVEAVGRGHVAEICLLPA